MSQTIQLKRSQSGYLNQINSMNQIYTKTHIGISVKAFFMKMYLLIKSIIANFYDKMGGVSADDSLEISFSSKSSTLSVTKETKGFSNLSSRLFSRFYSRSGYREGISSLASKLAFSINKDNL